MVLSRSASLFLTMNEEAFFFPLFYDEQFQTSESRISSSSSVFFHVNAEKVKKKTKLVKCIMCSGYAQHQNCSDTFVIYIERLP